MDDKQNSVREIKSYDRTIKKRPNEHTAYYAKANALLEFATLVPDNKDSYKEEALSLYDKAIELDPENPLYYIDRAKLHIDLQQDALALHDIIKASEFYKGAKDVVGMYVRNTTSELTALFIENCTKELNGLNEGLAILNEKLLYLTSQDSLEWPRSAEEKNHCFEELSKSFKEFACCLEKVKGLITLDEVKKGVTPDPEEYKSYHLGENGSEPED